MATVKVLPARLNYKILRGDDFADVVTIKEAGTPVDVSTRTFTAQVRSTPDGEVVVAMDINMDEAASGEVGYSIPDEDTAELNGSYVWDFQQETSGGVIRTLMGGNFGVVKDVTRAS